ALLLAVLLALNLFTIGSLFVAPVRAINEQLLSDPTFTGRTDIWQFAIDKILERPWLGHGFGAFWETEETVYAPELANIAGNESASASHAHNGFLDLALTTGIPGLALGLLWTLVVPLRDLQRCNAAGAHPELTTLFLRIWLFGLYTCCFESVLFDHGAPHWFAMLVAMFGLRYLSTLQLAVDRDR